jgi:hypothetical protein
MYYDVLSFFVECILQYFQLYKKCCIVTLTFSKYLILQIDFLHDTGLKRYLSHLIENL